MTPKPPGDTPKQRVEAAITKADRCMNHDGAMEVFSPLVRDLASELADAIAQVEELRRQRDSATALAAKCEALEKLVIELTLIAISTAHIKHHHKSRLDQLLSELQYAGIESPSDGTQREAGE